VNRPAAAPFLVVPIRAEPASSAGRLFRMIPCRPRRFTMAPAPRTLGGQDPGDPPADQRQELSFLFARLRSMVAWMCAICGFMYRRSI
jgi:hypothetical protein